MNRNGFSLIELLAVILVVGIVGSIAVWGYRAINKNANINSQSAKETVILTAAKMYGSDNYILVNTSCKIDNKQTKCLIITIQKLIDNNYYSSIEKCKDASATSCVYNDVTKKIMNNEQIVIYDEGDNVNASFIKDVNVQINP